MISREDFMFTIGYDGDTAVVDGKSRARYGKLTTTQLIEEGLYRSAFASALYSGNASELEAFEAAFNAKAGTSYRGAEAFKRLFGVQVDEVRRVLVL